MESKLPLAGCWRELTVGICSFTFYPSFFNGGDLVSDWCLFCCCFGTWMARKIWCFFESQAFHIPMFFTFWFLVLNQENLAGQLHGELELSGAPSRGNSALRGQEWEVVRWFLTWRFIWYVLSTTLWATTRKVKHFHKKPEDLRTPRDLFLPLFLFCAWTKRNPTQISSDFLTPFIQHVSFTKKTCFSPHPYNPSSMIMPSIFQNSFLIPTLEKSSHRIHATGINSHRWISEWLIFMANY